MVSKNYILAIPLTSIDVSTFTGDFQAINAGGLPDACTILRFINDSDRDVTISYDGVTPHDYLRLTETLSLNFQANKQPSGYVSMIMKGTVVYVAGTAQGTGFVYLAGYYNPKS